MALPGAFTGSCQVETQSQQPPHPATNSSPGPWLSYTQHLQEYNTSTTANGDREDDMVMLEPEPLLAKEYEDLLELSIQRYISNGTIEQGRTTAFLVESMGPPSEMLDLLQEVLDGSHGGRLAMLVITVSSKTPSTASRILILNQIGCQLDLPQGKMKELWTGSKILPDPGIFENEDFFRLCGNSTLCNVVHCTAGTSQFSTPFFLLPSSPY